VGEEEEEDEEREEEEEGDPSGVGLLESLVKLRTTSLACCCKASLNVSASDVIVSNGWVTSSPNFFKWNKQ
jgi:hypothetical protein